MITYFTSLPMGRFSALDDSEAVHICNAQILYRESDDGSSFVVLRGKDLMEAYDGE